MAMPQSMESAKYPSRQYLIGGAPRSNCVKQNAPKFLALGTASQSGR
jgi:hypothetical protein